MSRECAICKQPAVVAARITRGDQTATAYFCENCARRVGKRFRVEIVGSAIQYLPKGMILTPATNHSTVMEKASNTIQQQPVQGLQSTANLSQSTSNATFPHKCSNCGSVILNNAKFCPECGCKLIEPSNVLSADNPPAFVNTATVTENGKKRKSKKIGKIIVVIAILAVLVGLSVSGVFLYKSISLDAEESYVLEIVKKYKNSLKDPDSLVLRGNIMYIDNSDGLYVIFTASGTNSYGAVVTSSPVYSSGSYLADLNDDPDDIDDLYDALELAGVRLLVTAWNAANEINNSDSAISFNFTGGPRFISGRKIAWHIRCAYKEG